MVIHLLSLLATSATIDDDSQVCPSIRIFDLLDLSLSSAPKSDVTDRQTTDDGRTDGRTGRGLAAGTAGQKAICIGAVHHDGSQSLLSNSSRPP
jgi:hypothetical protein